MTAARDRSPAGGTIRRNTSLLLIAAVVLSGAGVYVSVKLLQKHLLGSTGSAWFDDVCTSDGDSSVNCAIVLSSDWAYFPPNDEAGNRRPFSVPVALLGLWYFTGLGTWYLFVGRPDYNRRRWHLLPLIWNTIGIMGSVFFLIIMFTSLEAICPWCLVSHGVNALLMVCGVLLRPMHTSLQPTQVSTAVTSESIFDTPEPGAVDSIPTPNPTVRHAVSAMVLVLALASAQFYWISAQSLLEQGLQLKADVTKSVRAIEKIKQDGHLMMALFQQQPKREIPIRSDDPVRGEGRGLFDVVVFSDFQCPRCRDFAQRLDTQVHELFGSDMRVMFKHFPLCVDCNTQVARTIHESACRAARAAEAARLQGGSQAFWTMHDRLFADQKNLASFNYRGVAEELGLSPDQLLADMESDAVAERIEADSRLATQLSVRGTPAVFVMGRRVDSIARSSDAFWKELHTLYRRALDKRNAALEPAAEHDASAPASESAEPPGG